MRYKYRAYNSTGKIIKGKIERKSIEEVRNFIQSKNLIPVDIVEDEGFGFNFSFSSYVKKQKNLIYFFNQLYFYIKSGFTIDKSLDLMQSSIKDSDFNMMIASLNDSVKKGNTFSESLANIKNKYFNKFIINVIKSGEISGTLADSLKLIKDYLTNNYKVHNKIVSSMIYPVFVISISMVILFILMLFVIPSVSDMFERADIELPLLTQIVIGLSNFIINYFYMLIILFILSIIFFFKYIKKSYMYFKFLSFLKLKMPFYKNIYITELLYKFSNSTGLLLANGVDIITSLQVGKDIINNHYYNNNFNDIISDFKGGEKLSDLFKRYDLFDANFNETFKLGEESGQLSVILKDSSEYFKEELNEKLDNFVSLIEPVLILFLGLFVGAIIFSIMMPIFNISSFLRN
jgi:type II secretory pathway component PulF